MLLPFSFGAQSDRTFDVVPPKESCLGIRAKRNRLDGWRNSPQPGPGPPDLLPFRAHRLVESSEQFKTLPSEGLNTQQSLTKFA
jgi:hypothetical protein